MQIGVRVLSRHAKSSLKIIKITDILAIAQKRTKTTKQNIIIIINIKVIGGGARSVQQLSLGPVKLEGLVGG